MKTDTVEEGVGDLEDIKQYIKAQGITLCNLLVWIKLIVDDKGSTQRTLGSPSRSL